MVYHIILKEFLEQEKNNNEEIEKKITTSERQSVKIRLDYHDLEQARVQLKDEVEGRYIICAVCCACMWLHEWVHA